MPANEMIDTSAWTAEERQWYASLLAHCHLIDGAQPPADASGALLALLNHTHWRTCFFMDHMDVNERKVEDSRHQWWAETGWPEEGRWNTTRARKKVPLQRELGKLRHRHPKAINEVVSHLCGQPSCVRLQHLQHQSRRDDSLDRSYHDVHGVGSFREDADG